MHQRGLPCAAERKRAALCFAQGDEYRGTGRGSGYATVGATIADQRGGDLFARRRTVAGAGTNREEDGPVVVGRDSKFEEIATEPGAVCAGHSLRWGARRATAGGGIRVHGRAD